MNTKQIIEQYEEKLLKAFKECNVEEIEKLIHDDLIFNGPDGQVLTKEKDLEVYKSGNAVFKELACIKRKINIFNDTAVVSTVIQLKGIFMGNSLESKARFLRVWNQFDGSWKVIGGSSVVLDS